MSAGGGSKMAKGLEEGRLKSYIIMMTRILYINCQAHKDSRKGVPGVCPPKKIKIVNGGIER